MKKILFTLSSLIALNTVSLHAIEEAKKKTQQAQKTSKATKESIKDAHTATQKMQTQIDTAKEDTAEFDLLTSLEGILTEIQAYLKSAFGQADQTQKHAKSAEKIIDESQKAAKRGVEATKAVKTNGDDTAKTKTTKKKKATIIDSADLN